MVESPVRGSLPVEAPEGAPGSDGQAAPAEAPGLLAPADDWPRLAELFEREAAALGRDPGAARLLHEAARIRERRLHDRPGALALYRRASALAPAPAGDLQSARRVALELGLAREACDLLAAEAAATGDRRQAAALGLWRARLLEDAVRAPAEGRAALRAAAAADPESLPLAEHEAALAAAERRFEDLARALERCAERVQDPELSAAWLLAAAAVEDGRLGRGERAAALAERAFAKAPGDPAVRAAARHHAERQGRHELLASVLTAEATQGGTPPRDAALAWCALARLLEERLGRPEEASQALARARELGESDVVVLDALTRLHEDRGQWEAAAEVLRARAAAHLAGAHDEPSEVIEGNLRLAELCAERLGRTEEAAACYRAVLAIDPAHRVALAGLGRIHAAASDWPKLLETFLAERAAAVEKRDRAQRCYKAAELLEERLGRVDDAVELYAEALALDPELGAARQALERLYERSGRHAELAKLIEGYLGEVRDPAERTALLFRLARLQEDRLHDLTAAAASYERVLEAAPEHRVALRALADLHERAGRWAELIAVLGRMVTVTAEPRQAVALLQRMGEVEEKELGDLQAATATFERALKLDPMHLPALRALGRLYGRAERHAELVAMCRAEADITPSTEAAANLHYRIGEILEQRLGQESEAIAAYREVLTLAPAHVGALRALAKLYRGRQAWEDLAEVLLSDAAGRASPERKAVLLSEAATVFETRLADLGRAIELHEEALRLAPGLSPSAQALDRLFSDAGRWQDLVELRRGVAELARGPARAAALVSAGQVLLDRLEDPAGALASCRAALAATPGDPGALLLLARLPEGRTEARARLAQRLTDPAVAAQLLAQAALDRGDGMKAPELLRAAALAPGHPVAGPLVEEALMAEGGPPALAAHFAARRDEAREPAEKALWALREGEVWEGAGDDERAILAYRESRALSAGALPTLLALERVAERRGAWGEARDALLEEGTVLHAPALAAAALTRAGEIALERLSDQASATADFRRALERDPLDEPALERLGRLLTSSGKALEACALYEERARAETEPERVVARFTAASRVALELGDRDRALSDADRALATGPAWEALALRGRALAEAGRPAEAARDLAACLAHGASPEQEALLHLELAALYEGPLEDAPRAVSHLNAVLSLAPDHPGALGRLARIHREARNWPAAAAVLRRLIGLPNLASTERRDRLLELADVRERGYDDPTAATALCEQALELVPGDRVVLERLARLKDRRGDHPGVVSALEAAAASLPLGPQRARAYLRTARVLSTALGESRQAIAELKRALLADPSYTEARVALVDLYATSEPALAVEEHRRFLAEDPGRLESWHALYAIFQAGKAYDRAFVVASVLRFLKASDPASDGLYYGENAPQAPPTTSAVLAPSEWLALHHPSDRGPLSELLALVGDVLGEVVDLAPEGRPKVRGPTPLTALAEELLGNVGVKEVALRPVADGDELLVEPGSPPTLYLGAALSRRPPPEQRFLIARAAARLRARSALAERLAAGALGELMAAVVCQTVPGYAGTGQPSERLVRSVGRALPRKLRKVLEEPSRALARAPAPSVSAWQAGLSATADRIGLFFATDLVAALEVVQREGGVPAESLADLLAAARGRPGLRQLLLFAVSEEHFRLRQRLKLAIA